MLDSELERPTIKSKCNYTSLKNSKIKFAKSVADAWLGRDGWSWNG